MTECVGHRRQETVNVLIQCYGENITSKKEVFFNLEFLSDLEMTALLNDSDLSSLINYSK